MDSDISFIHIGKTGGTTIWKLFNDETSLMLKRIILLTIMIYQIKKNMLYG